MTTPDQNTPDAERDDWRETDVPPAAPANATPPPDGLPDADTQ